MPSKYTSKAAYGTATGPLGFPMPDALAKAADSALKALPKDIRERCKTTVTGTDGKRQQVEGYMRRETFQKAESFDDGEHSDVSIITSDTVDRDKEVVMARGLDFSQFQRNPVVTFCHMYSAIPMGKCLWVKMQPMDKGDCWKAKTQYTPRPGADLLPADEEWFPDIVWHYVKEGYMPGKSIGFIPLEYRDMTPDEVRANPDWAEAYGCIPKALVLEYATCPVQANPDALVESVAKMRAKGVTSKSLTDALGLIIPGEEPQKKTSAVVEIKSFVRPETIQKAVNDELLKNLDGLASRVKEQFVDRIYREMGKV